VLNNEMDDFALKAGVPNAFGLIGTDANAVVPGKRMLSSMTPTFVLGEDRVAVIGTPGGSRIITMVLLALLDVVDGKDAASVVGARRIHHQYLPDAISAETGALDEATVKALEAKGHTVESGEREWGNMHIAIWNRADNSLDAASDPRWSSGRAEVR
jgi:gamma-glutamyltranspeptidase/glutathione hydrolase